MTRVATLQNLDLHRVTVAIVVIYDCDFPEASSAQMIHFCCTIATVDLCSCDFALLRSRLWLFQVVTVGLFSKFPYLLTILLAFRLRLCKTHNYKGLDIKIAKSSVWLALKQ